MMKTNDVKKGCRVQLTNGSYVMVNDNMKGDTRRVTREGNMTDMVYSHDMVRVECNNVWVAITLTPKQTSLRALTHTLGF